MTKQNGHKYHPFLIHYQNNPNHLVVIIFSSSERRSFVLSEFIFPSTNMVLEKCKRNSSLPPNSFIIFRTFFSSSISDSISIPSYHVGERSKIAQSVWKVASENLKNAFKLLEKNVREYLYSIKGPSFVPFKYNNQSRGNRRVRRFSTNRNNESFPIVEKKQKFPSLNFEVITPDDFCKTNKIEPSVHFQFENNFKDFISPSNNSLESFDDLSSIQTSQLSTPSSCQSLMNDFTSFPNNSGSFDDLSSIQTSQSSTPIILSIINE